MHYYRYRQFSEVSLKELLYSELFFTAPEECNDPFDSKSFYQFPKDPVRWARLFEQVLIPKPNTPRRNIDELTQHLAAIICKQCPILLDDLMSRDHMGLEELKNLLPDDFLKHIVQSAKRLVSSYIPNTRYFASFSKSDNELTMWSHYASNHTGYCLIFKAVDGQLYQHNILRKGSIHRVTPNSFSENCSYQMPEAFPFLNINYVQDVEPINAFCSLNTFIYGQESDEKIMAAIREEQERHYLQKQMSWLQEQEARLILNPPPAFVFGGHFPYTKHERLFHYEPAQLVGVIFGARMDTVSKERVLEILEERYQWNAYQYDKQRFGFNFFVFEARLSSSQRAVDIIPLKLLGQSSIGVGSENFERLYREWQQGWGWKRVEKRSARFQFK